METISSKRSCKDHDRHDPNFCVPPVQVKIDERGLGPLLYERLKQHSDKVLQINAETGQQETSKEFLSRVIRCAQQMKAQGVVSGDIISFCTWNNMDCYVPLIAALMINAIIAPLDPTLALQDTVYLLKLIKPKLIFCDDDGTQLIERALLQEADLQTKIVVFGETDKHQSFSQFQLSTDDENDFIPTPAKNVRDTALLSFSSGTTGLPKGVCISHYSCLYQLSLASFPFMYYAVTRMYWFSSTAVCVHSIFVGGGWIVVKNFDMEAVYKIIADHKVTNLICPPLFAYKLLQNAEHCVHDTSSLLILTVAGGNVGETQVLALQKLFPKTIMMNAYGSTESAGNIILFNIMDPVQRQQMNKKVLSMGRITAGSCVKVVDVETGIKITTPNTPGELRVKAVFLTDGYYNDEKQTAASFDSEGYFCTGDVVYFDEDNCFFFKDRIKDLMKYQGWTLAPVEIESVLLTHPDIAEACVIALPHEEDGSHPLGIVVLRKGSELNEEEIIKFVEERVTDPKRLRGGVRIIESIPKTPSYKLRRRDLRNMVLEGVL
ncbi:uncharacterized protein CBL_11250 [Carabus blaptoides fortunei]